MRLCILPGCGSRRYAYGLCAAHHIAKQRYGDPNGQTPEKTRQARSAAGKASWRARQENGIPMPNSPGRPDFFTELARDQARKAERRARAK